MKWRTNPRILRRKIDSRKMTVYADRVLGDFNVEPIVHIEGKPCVRTRHSRDVCDEGQVIASIDFRIGQYVFPVAYYHPGTEKLPRFVGETKDVRHIPDKGWAIYLDAVLRDNDGEPVLNQDGLEIDLSGWFLESHLEDAGMGMETFRVGATAPSLAELVRERLERARAQ